MSDLNLKPKPLHAEDIEGWMDNLELSCLRHMASHFSTLCEIGAYKGRTTHAFLTSLASLLPALTPAHLLTVDTWRGSVGEHVFRNTDWDAVYQEFIHNTQDLPRDLFPRGRRPAHTIARGDSATVGKGIWGLAKTPRFECTWIDGGHSYDQVTADIAAWLPLTSHLICGHDYDWPSVKMAVDTFFKGSRPVHTPELRPRIWYVNLTSDVPPLFNPGEGD